MGSTNPTDEIPGSALDLTVLGLNSGTSMVSGFYHQRKEVVTIQLIIYIIQGWHRLRTLPISSRDTGVADAF